MPILEGASFIALLEKSGTLTVRITKPISGNPLAPPGSPSQALMMTTTQTGLVYLDQDGDTVKIWQLDMRSGVGRSTPIFQRSKIPAMAEIVHMDAETCRAFLVDSSHQLWVIEQIQMGQKPPRQVCLYRDVRMVACGDAHTMLLCADGLYTLRDPQRQQQSSTSNSNPFGSGYLSPASSGGVFGGGLQTSFAFGTGPNNPPGEAARVHLNFQPTSVWCGGNYTLITDSYKILWASGTTRDGSPVLSDSTGLTNTFREISPPIREPFQVACGPSHVAWIDSHGTLLSWGLWSNRRTRVLEDVISVSAVEKQLFALKKDGCPYSGGVDAKLVSGSAFGASSFAFGSTPSVQQQQPVQSPDAQGYLRPDTTLSADHFHRISGCWIGHEHELSLGSSELATLQAVAKEHASGAPKYPASLTPWQTYQEQLKPMSLKTAARRADLEKNVSEGELKIKTLQAQVEKLEQQLHSVRASLAEEQTLAEASRKNLALSQEFSQELQELMSATERAQATENQRNAELCEKLALTPLPQWTADDLPLALWRMDLLHRKDWFAQHEIDGHLICSLTCPEEWRELGLSNLEASRVLFHVAMMQRPGYAEQMQEPDEECVVCHHITPHQSRNLLKERDIPVDLDGVEAEGWVAPYLIYASMDKKGFGIANTTKFIKVMRKMKDLRQSHEEHLQRMK